jgi:hypothetical protein
MNNEPSIPKSKWPLIVQGLIWIIGFTFILIIVLLILINIPSVQSLVAQKLIESLQKKTGTEMRVNSVKIAFPNSVLISGLFIRDQNSDTLLYMSSLNVDLDIPGLIQNKVSIRSLKLDNVVANIHRNKSESKYNFQFIFDLFILDGKEKPKKEENQTQIWVYNVNDIQLKNIRFRFYDAFGGTNLNVNLGGFVARFKEIDFTKKSLAINDILLKNTNVALALSPITEPIILTNTDITEKPINIFLGFDISANSLKLENNSFILENTSTVRKVNEIDYKHLNIKNINSNITNIQFGPEGYLADFKTLSLVENCGIEIKNFTANAHLTNNSAELEELQIETGKSKISGNLKVLYQTFNTFIDDLWNSNSTVEITNSQINTDEVALFAPIINKNEYFKRFKHSDVFLSANATGTLNNLKFGNIELSVLSGTFLKTKGTLSGLPEITKINYDATIDKFSSNLTDVYKFIDPVVFAGLSLPQYFELKGDVKGGINSVQAALEFSSNYGNIVADAQYHFPTGGQSDSLNIGFKAQNILAGRIISDTLLGDCSFTGVAAGSGIIGGPLLGSTNIDIEKAQFYGYLYHDVHVETGINGNQIVAKASSTDTNFSFRLSAEANLGDELQKYYTRCEVANIDLQMLNLSPKNISFSTNLKAELNYAGLNSSEAKLEFANTVLKSETIKLLIEIFNVNAISSVDSLTVSLNSDFVDGTVHGNIEPQHIQNVLLTAYKKYFGIPDSSQLQLGKHLDFKADLHIPKNIISGLIPGLDTLLVSKLEGRYLSDNNELNAELQMPKAVYSNINFDSLSLVINGKNQELAIQLQLDKISNSSIQIKNISVIEQINSGKITSQFSVLDSVEKPRYLFANQIEMKEDGFTIKFLPEGLVLDGGSWHIDDNNLLEMGQNKISAQKFDFSKDNQRIDFKADQNNRKLSFTNFDIQNLVNIIDFQKYNKPIKGDLSGEVDFPLPGQEQFISANLTIDSLLIRDTLTGNMLFKIKTTNDKMDINSEIVYEQNKLSVNGNIDHLSGIPALNLEATLNISDLKRIEKFTFGNLSEMNGKINSQITLKGTASNPEINGFIGFDKTEFKVNSLNFLAKIEDEKIQLDNKGIHFNDFVVEDSQTKKLSVNGDVQITDFSGYEFDLHLITNDFQPMNSTLADNKLFYGKLSLATDIWLKGNMENPDIQAKIKIDSATNLTYALPGSNLKLYKSEGIVNFLAPDQRYDSIYVVKEAASLADSIMSKISGINLSVDLAIDPNAKFTVDVDPKSGDYLTLSGSANLKMNVDRAGKQSIVGVYEVKSGLYELSFYKLVKKTFIIVPGSTVSWTGNPKDADVNISAIHTVTTPSTALMANESTTMSETEKNMFKQRLPYDVKLNILGFLTQPQISFNITLADKYLAANSMIASKLSQLNAGDRTDDLNKQVFALLVTGGFIADNPTSTGGSASNIASTAARNSVNGILAGQMNNMSSKFIHNVDVNFGLTTFDDGTTGSSDPTTELDVQVSKKLFNERVTIEAQSSFDLSGNKNTTPTSSDHNSGEVAVTYKLTEDGEYKMKAFSQTAYDLFDGDIVSSGIALMFTKEFETLKKKKRREAKTEK